MTKVILINPPIYFNGNFPISLDASFPPLGPLYLAAILEKQSISVSFLDIGATKQTLDEIIQIIKKERPLLIGISAMTPTLQGALTLAQEIKRRFGTKIKICLGGPHVSADPDFINRNKYFDIAITGESEITFLKIVKSVLAKKRVSGIYPGVPEHHLDRLPWPARHLVDPRLYLKKASLIATRGCPFNCYYCSRPAVSNIVRCRSPQDIVAEMDSLYDQCHGEYLFQDDSLTINREHTVKLCQELLKKKRKYRWAGYTRVDLVDPELLALMAKAGCFSLTFGIESGDEKLRHNLIKKRFTNQKIKEVIGYCRQFHIDADGFFMFGHPTETKRQVKKTVDFILHNHFNIVGVSIATPFPGSNLWDYAVKDKVVDLTFVDRFAQGKLGQGYTGIYPVYHPRNIKLHWLYQMRRYTMRHFYLRPQYVIQRFLRDITSWDNITRDFKEGINVFIKGSSARAPYQKEVKYQ